MGKLISFGRHQHKQHRFVLVVARTERDWLTVSRQLEKHNTELVASYYLTEQLGTLRQSRLLADYSACVVVGADGICPPEKQELACLALTMPLLLIKEADNVFDMGLEHLSYHSLSAERLGQIDLAAVIHSLINRFRAACSINLEAQGQRHRWLQTSSTPACMAVTDADVADAESFVGNIIDSLRVVARTRGIDLAWDPQGEDLPVLLHRQRAKRHLIDLFLEIFNIYTVVSVMTSPRSLICEQRMWMDIVARRPRFSDRFLPELSEAFAVLRETLRLNQGDLFLVEQAPDSVIIRMECHLSDH
ncbi:MAG: hypothetical protein R3208_19135 [Ketobacteraceae bacterium]|nr:hypothetical protein [Ketobacteraceae bacterium]